MVSRAELWETRAGYPGCWVLPRSTHLVSWQEGHFLACSMEGTSSDPEGWPFFHLSLRVKWYKMGHRANREDHTVTWGCV